MRVAAPGKLLLTGAYAVLAGAPAVVVGVDRYALADDASPDPCPAREVIAAFGRDPAPRADARALYEGESKLGLGSSAAVLVACLGAREAARGERLGDAVVRRRIFERALDAHARAQGGGSGVDVAASVYGGSLIYTRGLEASVRPVPLPTGLVIATFFSGTSARTRDLRAQVDALRARDDAAHAACFAELSAASASAAASFGCNDTRGFIAAAGEFRNALAHLGAVAGAPIVLPAFAELGEIAAADGAVFLPSGAGGGDVGVYLGCSAPPATMMRRAQALGMTPIRLAVDRCGVHVLGSEEKPDFDLDRVASSERGAAVTQDMSDASEGISHG